MIDFEQNGYVLIKHFLDPQAVSVVSQYLENLGKRYPTINQAGGPNESSRVAYYADPLVEVLLQSSLPDVEKITNLSLLPTYSFSRVYLKGDELKPHVDRPSCEISVTCHIATVGKPWPVYMQAKGKEPTIHYLEPGDACVYRGCDVKHWRDPAVETDVNVQVMLHYVDKYGPNAAYKFDQRQSLGTMRK